MSWQTWTKISSVILFIIAILGFYYANYYHEGPALTIENFPVNLDSLDTTDDIQFSFFLYNGGDQTAFVKSIILLRSYEDGSQVADAATIAPMSDFSIEPGESKEILVTLPAPDEDTSYTLSAEIFYTDEKVVSETIPVVWGALL